MLLSFLSVWTTGYIVNSYVETVLKQLGLPLQVQPPGLTGFWGKLWGVDAPQGADSEKKSKGFGETIPDRDAAGHSAADYALPENPGAGNPEPRDFQEPYWTEANSPAGGSEMRESAGADGNSAVPENVPVFGAGENLLEISEDDREILRSIMMQLNEEQLLQLTRLLADGWNESEWEAAAKLLKGALNSEDYNILMEILSRTISLRSNPEQPAQNQAF
jgi:hypothetical protein